MSGNSTEKLVYMANQIANFFVHQPRNSAAMKIASHIDAYWDPRMRRMIVEHLEHGGEGFTPVVAEAIRLVRTTPRETIETSLAAAGDPSVPYITEDDAG